MTIEAIVLMLGQIADQLENLWIEKDAYGSILFELGFSDEKLQGIAEAAKSDPEKRKEARLAFAEMRAAIEETGKFAAIELLAAEPPKPGESN